MYMEKLQSMSLQALFAAEWTSLRWCVSLCYGRGLFCSGRLHDSRYIVGEIVVVAGT